MSHPIITVTTLPAKTKTVSLSFETSRHIQQSTLQFVNTLKAHLETETVPARIAWLNKTIEGLEIALLGVNHE